MPARTAASMTASVDGCRCRCGGNRLKKVQRVGSSSISRFTDSTARASSVSPAGSSATIQPTTLSRPFGYVGSFSGSSPNPWC